MRRITMMLALLVLSLGLYAANVNPIATAFTNGNASALEIIWTKRWTCHCLR